MRINTGNRTNATDAALKTHSKDKQTEGRTDGLTEVFHEALADLKNIRIYQVYFVISKSYIPNEMPGKSLEIQASEKFQEFPALPEPEFHSIPNPKKHPLGTDATQPFGIWRWAAKMVDS